MPLLQIPYLYTWRSTYQHTWYGEFATVMLTTLLHMEGLLAVNIIGMY